ncbi:MAG TPA: chemotaxis protein CheA [Steroidobacteraceae bacterium]|jgi:two-component system chemotaxis sensor kinase CheA|nr:chemotaxis protein CheA [Steroidobacteraceae bacterium]
MTIDLTQFHDAFYEESSEAIGQMEHALLRLDAGTPDPELINTIFRVAHSIKGGAATFGFAEITSFTHTLETLLDELRGQRLKVTVTLSDLLLRSIDVMREMLRAQQAQQPIDQQRVADLQFDLELAVAQKVSAPAAASAPESAAVPGVTSALEVQAPLLPERHHGTTYQINFRPYLHLLARGNDPLRMFRELRDLGDLQVTVNLAALPPIEELDPENCYLSWQLMLNTDSPRQSVIEVFDWAEGDCELEVITLDAPGSAAAAIAAATAAQSDGPGAAAANGAEALHARAHKANEAVRAVEAQKSGEAGSIRVSVEKIDDLMNSVGELVITQSMLGQLGGLLDDALGERLRSGLAQLERNVRELQESVMRVRMVPISFVFSRFPRMVRDLSQRLNKQVELKMTGGETELDKTVLEKIGDPLVHLVRNSVDHGIEMPAQRLAAGKDPCGVVHLHAYHRGSTIVVEVTDDGGGLRRERILEKARERGLIGPTEELTDEAIFNLIFVAGFSTQEHANDVSGRGVGMDVVKRNVEELGGSIEVHSAPGGGSRFTITLPLTLAIVDGQTIAVGEETYIVPLTAIIESLQMKTAAVNQVVGHGEVLTFRGEYLPVVRLQKHFNSRADRAREASEGLIMVVEGDGRRVGLCVDELLGQQQVVVKTLEANYGHVEGIAGATILGDGSVALILDVANLTRTVTEKLAA